MKRRQRVNAVIKRVGEGYIAVCPRLDVSGQGSTVEEARRNLIEALELFFETANPNDLQHRMYSEPALELREDLAPEVLRTQVEVNFG